MADALYRLNRQSPARTRAAEGTRRDIVFGRLTLPWDEALALLRTYEGAAVPNRAGKRVGRVVHLVRTAGRVE